MTCVYRPRVTTFLAYCKRSACCVQSSKFRDQLDGLMLCLESSDPHFVRCIKPNDKKKELLFIPPMCLAQLRYAGVFEAVRILQEGTLIVLAVSLSQTDICMRSLKGPACLAPLHLGKV